MIKAKTNRRTRPTETEPVAEPPVAEPLVPEAEEQKMIEPLVPEAEEQKMIEPLVPVTEEKPEPAAKKRGRPAQDRQMMVSETISALQTAFPEGTLFNRKDLGSLPLPISYILHFVKIAATPVRGLYVIPREYRKLWPGYEARLKAAMEGIYKK